MPNTKTQGHKAEQLQPKKVAEALYHDIPVEHRGWLIRINAEKDTIEVFPPKGDTRHQAFETDLCHLDRAVKDFCKLAEMPIPGINKHPKDQVSVGSPKKLLGPDSSVGEGWKNPKINERPTGLDQKGTSAPNKNLGVDTSSQNVPHFNPAINKRPKDPVGRGGLPNTDLGPDSTGAETHWRDRIVKVQEDGRTGRRGVQKKRADRVDDKYPGDYPDRPYIVVDEAALPSGGGTLLNDPEDMDWLRSTHLSQYPGITKNFNSALIYGDESSPEFICLYESADPDYDDEAVCFGKPAEYGPEYHGASRRRALHPVQKPRRGPGQLGYGKAQMGEEAAPMVDGSGPSGGVVARRRAETSLFPDVEAAFRNTNDTIQTMYGWIRDDDPQRDQKLEGLNQLYTQFSTLKQAWFADTQGGQPAGVTFDQYPGYPELDKAISDFWNYLQQQPDQQPVTASRRRRADSDPFDVTPVEEPGKKLNKGEDPSDPKEVITTEQGEGEELRTESEGQHDKEGRFEDSFQFPKVDASEAYRQMTARRPSAELLKDILDPHKWAAGNLMDPAGTFDDSNELEPLPDEDMPGPVEDEGGDYFEPDADELVLYITNDNDLYERNLMPIVKNLMRKVKNGTFDETLSVKLWGYLAEAGAQKYAKEMEGSVRPMPWHKLFPTSVRQQAAQQLAEHYNPAILHGEFGDVWPKAGQANLNVEADGDVEGCSDGKKAVPPSGVEQGVFHGADDVPEGAMPVRGRRQAGPRLRENWGAAGEYGRDLEAESGEELHALTLALGGQEVDWSKFKPTMPMDGVDEEGEGQTSTQPEGPKANGAGAPSPAPAAPMTARMREEAAGRGLGFFSQSRIAGAPGKFEGNHGDDEALAEQLYEYILDGSGGDDELDFGNGEAGYVDIYNLFLKEKAILHNDNQGFVDVTTFNSPEETQAAWSELTTAWEAAEAEREPEDDDRYASRRRAGPADFIDPNEPKPQGNPTDEFLHSEGNPPVDEGQQMTPGSPIKQGGRRAHDDYSDTYGEDDGYDEKSPQSIADNYINGNWEDVINAIQGDVRLAFGVLEMLPPEKHNEYVQFVQKVAGKEAVDEKAKDYWGGYFGEYGKDLTEEKKLTKPPSGKSKKKEDPKEARRQAALRARKLAQAAAPIAQPAPPAQSPANPPASGAAPAAPGAPAAPKPAPGAPGAAPMPPKGPPGPMPAGSGDAGLQALGWTAEEISLMDEEDKKKILQIKLSKPGSNAKPKTPGSEPKGPAGPGGGPSGGGPVVPTIPPSPIAPTPGNVPAGATPAPGAPKPTAAVRERLAAMILKKVERRRAIRAQVTPPGSADPNMTPPVGTSTAAQPGAPTAGPTAPPGKSAPGAAATPPKAPPSGSEGSADQKAFDILQAVQQAPVSAASPEQVLSAKVSELARRLLTEIGMTTSDAKQLFGIPSDGGLDKLFQ